METYRIEGHAAAGAAQGTWPLRSAAGTAPRRTVIAEGL